MAPSALLRLAGTAAARIPLLRTSSALPRTVVVAVPPSSYSKAPVRFYSDAPEESFEEFTARYEKEFENRNLNNAFAYDLVPSPTVITAALRAARRVDDFPTAVRIFEGIKAKVENKQQYQQYLDELKDLREELGVALVEDLYPEK